MEEVQPIVTENYELENWNGSKLKAVFHSYCIVKFTTEKTKSAVTLLNIFLKLGAFIYLLKQKVELVGFG